MKLVKAGTYGYGDDPYKLLGKYLGNQHTIERVTVSRHCVVLLLDDGGSVVINKEGNASIFFDYFEEDSRVFLSITDLNPTLIGKTISRGFESITVGYMVYYGDGKTQVTGVDTNRNPITRYFSEQSIGDWYIKDGAK